MGDDPLVQDVLSAVRRGMVLPAEYPEAVPLRVGHAQGLYSVWETTDSHSDAMRRPNLVTAQGGFPAAKGLYIVGVEQGVKIPFAPPGTPGLCRWCSGDGLHPFLSERWRQILRNGVPLATGYAPPLLLELAIGVGPLKWSLIHYLWVAAGQGLDPLAMYGLELEAVRCPRCEGDGGRSFDWKPVSVAV